MVDQHELQQHQRNLQVIKMRVLIHCIRNNDYGDYSIGNTQSIEVENLEACFSLPEDKLLVIDDNKKTIYDDCVLLGMEEIK